MPDRARVRAPLESYDSNLPIVISDVVHHISRLVSPAASYFTCVGRFRPRDWCVPPMSVCPSAAFVARRMRPATNVHTLHALGAAKASGTASVGDVQADPYVNPERQGALDYGVKRRGLLDYFSNNPNHYELCSDKDGDEAVKLFVLEID